MNSVFFKLHTTSVLFLWVKWYFNIDDGSAVTDECVNVICYKCHFFNYSPWLQLGSWLHNLWQFTRWAIMCLMMCLIVLRFLYVWNMKNVVRIWYIALSQL